MIQAEKSIVIHRPVEEVFAYASDLRRGPEWQSALLEVRQTTAGLRGVGATFTSVRKFLGRKIEASAEIVEYERDARITFKSDTGPMSFTCSYGFAPVTEGTRLTCRIELRPGALFGLAEPVITGSVERELAGNFGDLKALLENRAVVISS